jgi:hypothetical protein
MLRRSPPVYMDDEEVCIQVSPSQSVLRFSPHLDKFGPVLLLKASLLDPTLVFIVRQSGKVYRGRIVDSSDQQYVCFLVFVVDIFILDNSTRSFVYY